MSGIKSAIALFVWFLIWIPTTTFVLVVLVRSFFTRPRPEKKTNPASSNGLLT
ncbi:MAG TPA: hypothetical protein VMW65_11995 [Chloroflexota bacterium]|nr:hypothetical protein [Chloroflexota bacterium]